MEGYLERIQFAFSHKEISDVIFKSFERLKEMGFNNSAAISLIELSYETAHEKINNSILIDEYYDDLDGGYVPGLFED